MKLLFGFILSLLSLHPLHVSITEIEFDEKEKRLEIMSRVFIDDLEETMRQRLKKPTLDILKLPAELTLDKLMNDYFAEKFKVNVDGKPVKHTYLGHERDADVFIFYIEVPNVKKLRTIQVQNDVIHEIYEDQSNIVHVTVKGKIRSMRLTKNKSADKIEFD